MRSGRTGQPSGPDAIPLGDRATLGHLALAKRGLSEAVTSAWEQPDLFAIEMRAAFRSLR